MLGYLVFILSYQTSLSFSAQFYYVASTTLSRGTYWLLLLCIVGTMVAVEVAINTCRRDFAPSDDDIAAERDQGYGTPGPNGHVVWGDDAEDAPLAAPDRNVLSPMLMSPRSPEPIGEPPSAASTAAHAQGPQGRILHIAVAKAPTLTPPGHAHAAPLSPPTLLPLPGELPGRIVSGPVSTLGGGGAAGASAMQLNALRSARTVADAQASLQSPPQARVAGSAAPATAPGSLARVGSYGVEYSLDRRAAAGPGGAYGGRQSSIPPPPATLGARPGTTVHVSGRDAFAGVDQQRLAQMGVTDAAGVRGLDYSGLNRGGAVSPASKVPSPQPDLDDTY